MTSLLRSILSIFSGKVVGILISLVFTPLLVRLLSQDQYGVYASVFAAFSIVTLLAKGGLFDATRKTVAEYSTDVSAVSSVITVSLFLSVGYSIVAVLFTFFAADLGIIPPKYAQFVLVLSVVIIFGNVFSIVKGSFYGLQRESITEVLQVGRRLSYTILALLFAYIGYDVLGVFTAYAFSFVLLGTIGLIILIKNTSYHLSTKIPIKQYGGQIASFGGYQLVGGISATLLYKSDILLVEFFHGTVPAALYQSAIVPAEMIWFVPSAIQLAFLQHTASLWAEGKTDKITQRLQTGVKYAILSLTLFGVGLFGLAGPFLSVYFGSDYVGAKMTLQILIFGTFFLGTTRVVTPVLHATGWVRQSEFVTVVGLLINIVLNVTLIPRYGIVGAGIGTGLSYVAIFVGNVTLWKYSQFDVVSLKWVGKLATAQGIFAVSFLGIIGLSDTSSWVSLLVFPPVGLILFLGINVTAGYIPVQWVRPHLERVKKYFC
ncbi:flippase [Haloarcula sp. K1]|uniref:flippase n=1 Tax=Haloarcula sp. K1 TaxID=1622207 RepID=UPI0007BAEB7B|nr:flippase [Haloarcula sp. K1]KZX48728.1 polysaccharide biosynthesis protein [Haloarcula sp. K1]